MKLLLDTQILLWAAGQPERLSAAARRQLSNPKNELLFSAASLWEITIKRALGREDFRVDPRILRRGLLDLHNDPFDRILLAQALTEGITLITVDAQLARYPGPVRQV